MSARTHRCARCGGSFEAELAAQLVCPFCAHRQAPAHHAELEGYQREVSARLGAAEKEYQHAAAYNSSMRRSGAQSLKVGYALMLGVPLVLALGAYALHAAGLLRADSPATSMVLMAGAYLAVIVYLVWWMLGKGRGVRRAEVEGAAEVRCPSCGAPGVLTPGQAVDRCAYCGAALLASAEVIEQGLDAATRAHRAARMERVRQGRHVWVNLASTGGANAMPWIIGGSMAMMIVPATLGFSWQMATGAAEYSPAIFIMWSLALGIVGGGVLFYRHTKAKKTAWRSALADVARQFGGQVFDAAAQWVTWLNRYWIGEIGLKEILQGRFGGAASVSAYGYPALILVDPKPQQNFEARVDILLAAQIPGLADGSASAAPPLVGEGAAGRDELGRRGFRLEIEESGLRVRAEPHVIAAYHRDPASAHELAPVLGALVKVARALGAEPAPPLP
jgi:hypothetical protein